MISKKPGFSDLTENGARYELKRTSAKGYSSPIENLSLLRVRRAFRVAWAAVKRDYEKGEDRD